MDRTTAKTTIATGEIYEWDQTAGAAGTGSWVLKGKVNTEYNDATDTQGGLLTDMQAVLLASVAMGAEVNVQADWNEANR